MAANTYLVSEWGRRKKEWEGLYYYPQIHGMLCQHSLVWADGLPQFNKSSSGGCVMHNDPVQASVLG